MARPTILDERLIAEFCAYLRSGASISTACSMSGIGRETYHGWVRNAKRGRGTKLQRRLVREADGALAEADRMAEAMLMVAGKKNWQALAWRLERRLPQEWGRRRPYADDDRASTPVTKIQWVDPADSPDEPIPGTSSTAPGPPSEPSTS